MKRTQIWQDALTERAGHHILTTRIEAPGQESVEIWFRIPSQYASLLTVRADVSAIIGIFTVMQRGLPVVIQGEVSPSLIRNLEEFQAAWCSWFPDLYKLVDITATSEREAVQSPDNPDAIAAFSGGVDAAYTAFRHQNNLCGRRSRNITRAMMIQGYDFPADDDRSFLPAYHRAKQMTDSLAIELIPVATNYREIEPFWENVHLACVAACLHLFAGSHNLGLVGSTEPYDSLVFPWASNPVTDPLLGNDTFRILHDGADANRVEKLRLLAHWQEAGENLLVCWEPTYDGRNCCRCNKCIRTILNYRVLGLERPAAFKQDVTNTEIRAMRHLNDTMVNDLEVILKSLPATNSKESWISALETVVKRYHLRRRLRTNPLISGVKDVVKRIPAGRALLHRIR